MTTRADRVEGGKEIDRLRERLAACEAVIEAVRDAGEKYRETFNLMPSERRFQAAIRRLFSMRLPAPNEFPQRRECDHGNAIDVNDCKECGVFKCPRCHRVVGWDEGGTDDEFCAKCWSETTAKTKHNAAPTGD